MFTKKNISLLVVVALIVSSVFYWFSLRPYIATRECARLTKDAAPGLMSAGGKSAVDVYYDLCMRLKGLNR